MLSTGVYYLLTSVCYKLDFFMRHPRNLEFFKEELGQHSLK